jgi:hypothetical protein
MDINATQIQSDHHKHDADVVEWVADQRRVEGVEDGRAAERHWNYGRHGADED